MNEEAETENEAEERALTDATAADLPPILRLLAERNLADAPTILEAVMGFTLTGAVVSIRSERGALAPRRLSHFVPDMLTRLAHELGAVGLVEVEISESKLPTRGFAFFLDAETVADIVPPAPEPDVKEPTYPDTDAGRMLASVKPLLDTLMAPMLAQMQQLADSVKASMGAQSEQVQRGMVFADLLAEQQIARARKMLEAEQLTPEQAVEGHLGALNQLLETAAGAKKALGKFAPKTDGDADMLTRIAEIAENPRIAAIGRGFLHVLGANIGAPIADVPVTAEAAAAATGGLPNLFKVG